MLTHKQVEHAKAKDKPYRLSDGGGLYLYVAVTGTRSWRYDYRFHGRPMTLTLSEPEGNVGTYPEISLDRARILRHEARIALAKGINPARLKQDKRNKNAEAGTFRFLAEEWFKSLEGKSKSWKLSTRRWLDKRILPALGKIHSRAVTPADVLAIMRTLEREGKPHSAEAVRKVVSLIFNHGVRNLRVEFNPAQALRGAVKSPPAVHHKHLSERELPDFMAKLETVPNSVIRCACRFLAHVFVRKGELTGAKWSEIDFERMEWRIPAERMKLRREHLVPLSSQAVAILEEVRKLTGACEYVFTVDGKRPIVPATLNLAFAKIGAGIPPHGLRGTASTILNERSGFDVDVIEAALAHQEKNSVRRAYNHAQYLDKRRALMEWWSDHLDNARHGNVVQLPVRVA